MTPLYKLLPNAEGSDLIRKCWREVPHFDGPCAIIHLGQSVPTAGQQDILLTALFLTNESDDGNKCKPSRIVVRFSGVAHWEYESERADLNCILLSDLFLSPPPDFLAVACQRFYVLCHSLAVLSCEHQPFENLDDEKVAT